MLNITGEAAWDAPLQNTSCWHIGCLLEREQVQERLWPPNTNFSPWNQKLELPRGRQSPVPKERNILVTRDKESGRGDSVQTELGKIAFLCLHPPPVRFSYGSWFSLLVHLLYKRLDLITPLGLCFPVRTPTYILMPVLARNPKRVKGKFYLPVP